MSGSWMSQLQNQIKRPDKLNIRGGYIFFTPKLSNAFEKAKDEPEIISETKQDLEIAKDKVQIEKEEDKNENKDLKSLKRTSGEEKKRKYKKRKTVDIFD